MGLKIFSFGALLLATATPAFAEDTDPPPAITINGTATLVSDYRFRGVSQTDKNFAVQGSLTITHKSGFYVSVWGSSVDDYVTASTQAHQEIDIIGGYKTTFGGTTIDIGALYYFYPKSRLPGDVSSSNFIEPYVSVSHTIGPVSAKATVNYAPKQKALSLNQIGPSRDSLYLAGDFALGIPKTPISLAAHVGHSFGPSWLATDALGAKGYTDWNLGASYTYKVLTFGVQYVDTDATFITTTGRNASSSGVVGSIGVSF
ncbi:MAG: hypothetical protein B7Y45_02160 [Sphingomonas sp. 28-66-16]|nr:MAG: hypothetical protein B7Y45_02160 [Sphingomonas sp. 28-66-16]